ncbi:hypothetical protein TSAR_014325, partial [Trichomalopsis sarcophagae]
MAMKTQQCQMCNRGITPFGNGADKFGGTQTYTLVQSPRTTVHLTSLQRKCRPALMVKNIGNRRRL